MAKKKKSTDINVTVFEILQAVTGELPCYASPNWKVLQEESPAPARSLRPWPAPAGEGSKAARPE